MASPRLPSARPNRERLSISIPARLAEYARAQAAETGCSVSFVIETSLRLDRTNRLRDAILQGMLDDYGGHARELEPA